MISIIVAFDDNRAIGKNNRMPWHIGADLKHFKQITMGHPVIMGRKTFESLPFKPLPGRLNIVLSRQSQILPDDVLLFHSIEEVLEYCKQKDDECFIIGGSEIYKQFLPVADKLYVTRVFGRFDADTFFPQWDENEWMLQNEERFDEAEIPFAFQEFLRK